MTNRQRPGPRRECVTTVEDWMTPSGAREIVLSIGFDVVQIDGASIRGAPIEVFFSGGSKSGSDLEHTISDAAILVSLLLQHGADPREIQRSLSSIPLGLDGASAPGSPAGVIVAAVAREWERLV